MDICVAPDAEQTLSELGTFRSTPPKTRTNTRPCRVCGRTDLYRYLNFGLQPIANALVRERKPREEVRAPLAVVACPGCKLSQLTCVMPRELLYSDYVYRSGVSEGWRKHCSALAERYASDRTFVVDIASNDGTLLVEFAKRGCQTLGVEPSPSFDDVTYNRVHDWWSAKMVQRTGLAGRVDVLTAQNVLGHVDDVHDFMRGVAVALSENGVAIIEVPYVMSLIEACAFDTIYHEHLSYWSVTALAALADHAGLVLRDVQEIPVHGGSIRAIIGGSGKRSDNVTRLLLTELHDLRRQTYMAFSSRVTRRIAEINAELLQHTPYVGFGAAAKTAVMLGVLDPRAYPYVVYDDNPEKWGKLIPGTSVRIEEPPLSWTKASGPMCLFSWNWADDIVSRLRSAGYSGAIYVPLPKPRWNTVDA